MSDLIIALDRILTWIQTVKPTLAETLQPGLSKAEIKKKTENLPFDLSQEIYELYQWHNGTNDKMECWFFAEYNFNSLDESLALYQKLMSWQDEFQTEFHEMWNSMWFPLFVLDIKENLFTVCADEKLQNSPILKYFIESGETIKYKSLTNMMLVIAECYETGVYYVDEIGIDFDEDEVDAVRLKYNS
jgi:cell wall assembly regulator SMI1